MYNVLVTQHSSGKGDLGDNSWQTIWQDFHMNIFPRLTFSFLFEIFHWMNYLTNFDCKYISMNLFQYSAFYPNHNGRNGLSYPK